MSPLNSWLYILNIPYIAPFGKGVENANPYGNLFVSVIKKLLCICQFKFVSSEGYYMYWYCVSFNRTYLLCLLINSFSYNRTYLLCFLIHSFTSSASCLRDSCTPSPEIALVSCTCHSRPVNWLRHNSRAVSEALIAPGKKYRENSSLYADAYKYLVTIKIQTKSNQTDKTKQINNIS